MKAKFFLLIAAGLFLATASQAQFHNNYKDSREVNRDRQEMAFDRNNISRDQRELRMDKSDARYDHKQIRKAKRHHHRHHGHRHGHRVS